MNKYIIALLKCKGVSNSKIARYIINNNFDSYKIKQNLRNIIDYEDFLKFSEYLNAAEIEIGINSSHNIKLITILDENFPAKLYEGNDPVVYLYYKGNINLLNNKLVSFVSSKDVNSISLEHATKVSSIISNNDITIVGGLTTMVDTFAHAGALVGNGSTIAVLPSDLNNIVPSTNKRLADDILRNNGCLISEYSVGHILNKYCYEKRDRVQSVIADALLVVDAKENSPIMDIVKKSKRENKLVYQLSTNMNKSIRNIINADRYSDIDTFIKKIKEEKRTVSEQLTLF